MILVTGASGTVGRTVLRALIDANADVRALVRQGAKLAGFGDVPVVEGDFADPASLSRALAGVESMFLLSPGVFELERAAIAAAAKAELTRVVLQSVLNADEHSECAILREHGESEGDLIDSGVPYVILRPNAFMQNIVNQSAALIKAQSVLALPLADAKISYVDVRDIADVAVVALTTPALEGETIEITGPRALSAADTAAALSLATGRTISYVNASDEATKAAMLELGMSADYADAVLKLFATYREGDAEFVVPSIEEIAGHPARTFGDFAKENVAAFR